MSKRSLAELLAKLRHHYRMEAGKAAKGRLIDGWVNAIGHERKYAIKGLRGLRCIGRGGGRPRYSPGVAAAAAEHPAFDQRQTTPTLANSLYGVFFG